MEQSELLKHLSDYAQKVNTGTATTSHFSDIKNKIRQAYDAGNLDKETMSELGKKASHTFKNMGKASVLGDIVPTIAEKGGTIGKFAEQEAPEMGRVLKSVQGIGGKLRSFAPLLGMLGGGAMALGAGQKAMAGDIPGALNEVVPPQYQVGELGKGSDETKGKEQFDFSPYKTAGAPPMATQSPAVNDSSIVKPNPTRYADLINQISLKKVKPEEE